MYSVNDNNDLSDGSKNIIIPRCMIWKFPSMSAGRFTFLACTISPSQPLVVPGTHQVAVATGKGGVLEEEENQVEGCKKTEEQIFQNFL